MYMENSVCDSRILCMSTWISYNTSQSLCTLHKVRPVSIVYGFACPVERRLTPLLTPIRRRLIRHLAAPPVRLFPIHNDRTRHNHIIKQSKICELLSERRSAE